MYDSQRTTIWYQIYYICAYHLHKTIRDGYLIWEYLRRLGFLCLFMSAVMDGSNRIMHHSIKPKSLQLFSGHVPQMHPTSTRSTICFFKWNLQCMRIGGLPSGTRYLRLHISTLLCQCLIICPRSGGRNVVFYPTKELFIMYWLFVVSKLGKTT